MKKLVFSKTKIFKKFYTKYKTIWEIKRFPYTNSQTYNSQDYIRVKMNSIDGRNAITPKFLSELKLAMELIDEKYPHDLPVVFLSEYDNIFSVGFDFDFLINCDENALKGFLSIYTQTFEKLLLWNRLTCAGVKGSTFGQGLTLALAW